MRIKGFTLIELMVVIIIIGILAAMAVPTFTKSMENAREKEARTTLELIYNAQRMYKIDKKVYAAGPGTNGAAFTYLSSYIENPNLKSDYYDFSITGTTTSLSATATRKGEPSKVFTIDSDGRITP